MNHQPIIIVGGGPAAWKFCQQLRQQGGQQAITCLCEEPLPPYNRIHLGRVLTEHPEAFEYENEAWYKQHNIQLICGDPVTRIHRQQRCVETSSGKKLTYSQLILATGSKVAVPPIPGIDETIAAGRVIPYRNVADAQKILEQSKQQSASHQNPVVVLGGGLLGVEAAGSLLKRGTQVELIEASEHLLPQLLATDAAKFLQQRLTSMGLTVRTSCGVTKIDAADNGQLALHLASSPDSAPEGRPLSSIPHCPLVVLATGIRPRDELAADAGLELGERGGIAVNSSYQSSDPHIYAIGECASINNVCVGLISPVINMASQVAKTFSNRNAEKSSPPVAASTVVTMKVADLPLTVMGPTPVLLDGSLNQLLSCQSIDHDQGRYSSLLIDTQNDSLRSATLIGDNPHCQEITRLLGMPGAGHRARQLLTGPAKDNSKAAAKPKFSDHATLCHCEGITVGEVSSYISSHPEASAETVKYQCGIARGCGNCQWDFDAVYQNAHPSHKTSSKWSQWLTQSIRVCHLYISLAAAVFLLFFAISGYAMNHRADLGMEETVDSELTELITPDLLSSSAKKPLLAKMKELGARGKLVEYERDDESVAITFQSAGRYFEASIDLEDATERGATAEIEISDSPFLETLGEIHRSESPDDSGSSLFIDVMSILMALVSLTGIALFFRMASRKNISALLYFALSCASAVWIYFLMR